MHLKSYSFLALGDSYTIGESVSPLENFPNQTVELLSKEGFSFSSPDIIAKTGWTTDELQSAVNQHHFKRNYDFVTLLIGVNNQYRGLAIGSYRTEFESLLQQAIQFAGNDTGHVAVISIPDWGVTPFAKGRNRFQIAHEIDEYNIATQKIALKYHIEYINITPWTREANANLSLLAADGLHPSAKEYRRWAKKISEFFKSKI
ncbi:MAG: SGNH/GDSL hydrolase family protein [Bacteroidia bacterium]|nr:SGNH/GDSL hydrolase family protein [Bacteroidia bacterium]